MAIKCCKGCVAPKRHESCWGHCPEYIREKESDQLWDHWSEDGWRCKGA